MTQDDIIEIVKAHTLIPDITSEEIVETDALLMDGIIDSLGLLKVVSEIEKRTGQSMPPHLLPVDNFSSVSSIQTLLEKSQYDSAS